jgi:hypothetical protein
MKDTLSEAGKRLSRLLKEACAGEEVVISGDMELSVGWCPSYTAQPVPRRRRIGFLALLKGKSRMVRTHSIPSRTKSYQTWDSNS